jgi:hypothetical protein
MVLVDSNVIMDVTGHDPTWESWSAKQLEHWGSREQLAVNPLIYAELSIDYDSPQDLDLDLSEWGFAKLDLPYEAAFIAGRAFLSYRRSGGTKHAPLPDFYIGAHAQVAGLRLLTRDAARNRTYFPRLRLIAPE